MLPDFSHFYTRGWKYSKCRDKVFFESKRLWYFDDIEKTFSNKMQIQLLSEQRLLEIFKTISFRNTIVAIVGTNRWTTNLIPRNLIFLRFC